MENKKRKGNGGIIFLIILIIIIIIGLVVFLLKEEGYINIGNSKKTKTAKETKVVESKKKNTSKEVTDESKIIYSGDVLRENKDFGKVTFGEKEVSIKYDNGDGANKKINVGDKNIEIINGGVNNIAIMGDFLVVGIDQDGYRFELYDKDLYQVEKLGNSLGLLMGTSAKTDKWIIDNNNLIYYDCTIDETSSTNFKLDLYNLKIDGSKIEKILLESTKDVNCSSQR